MRKSEMVMDAKDIERTIIRMTHRILEVHKGAADLTLIGIQTRGVFLATHPAEPKPSSIALIERLSAARTSSEPSE